MTADVAIEVSRKSNVLLVPTAALDRGRVWIKRNKHSLVKEVPVVTGIVDDERVEIVSGAIEEGDRLLIRKRANP
jgi:multidrug efflux pump subunit AcrA (membrane-fusion protein)